MTNPRDIFEKVRFLTKPTLVPTQTEIRAGMKPVGPKDPEAAERARQRHLKIVARVERQLALLDTIDPKNTLAWKILEAHSPEDPQHWVGEPGCGACAGDDYGNDPWPCMNVDIVAEHYGLNLEEA